MLTTALNSAFSKWLPQPAPRRLVRRAGTCAMAGVITDPEAALQVPGRSPPLGAAATAALPPPPPTPPLSCRLRLDPPIAASPHVTSAPPTPATQPSSRPACCCPRRLRAARGPSLCWAAKPRRTPRSPRSSFLNSFSRWAARSSPCQASWEGLGMMLHARPWMPAEPRRACRLVPGILTCAPPSWHCPTPVPPFFHVQFTTQKSPRYSGSRWCGT